MPQPSRPLRLLIMTDTAILKPGGSERFLRNLLARLAGDDYSIDVLQLAPQPAAHERVAEFDGHSIRLMYRPIEAIYSRSGIDAFRFVRHRVISGDYDIVQSQHEKSDLINAFLPRRSGVRRISNRRDMGFQKSRSVRALFRRANRRFDRIVAPSRSILDALIAEENARGNRCVAIPNGVDTERFRPRDDAARAALRGELGYGNDDCLIGCVASFTPVKRHGDLLRAFAAVHGECAHTRLLLVGEGPLRGAVEAQIAALGLTGSVRLLGARADVENILPALDVFALASSTEGMSNALLEAQACAVAVVATDVGGNADVIEQQVTGVLVPAAPADVLVRALCDLADDPRRRASLGKTARVRVARDHSLAAMTCAYERLYRELADGR